MAVTEAQIDAVAAEANRLFATLPRRSEVETALKAAFPGLRVAFCTEDDVNTKPCRDEAAYELYLIGGGGHCLSLTRDPEAAIGIVLAVRS
jgi:hypothetical protein